MKKIALSGKKGNGLFALVDDEDFEKLNAFSWHNHLGYARRGEIDRASGKNKMIMMHREILGITDSKVLLDHRDRNKLNNCKGNLKVCSQSDNRKNLTKPIGTTSKFIGVHWSKRDQKWIAQVHIEGKRIWLGAYEKEEDAARIRDERIRKLGNEFYVLNNV